MGVFAQTATDCKEGTTIVNVLDRHGLPLKGFTPSNFKVTSHGQEIAVLRAAFSNGAHRAVVLLDTSGSMSGETSRDEWKIARAAALEFVNSVAPGTQLSLATFAGDLQERTRLSGDPRAIRQWLDADPDRGSRPKGHTALFEAVLGALKGLDPVQPGDAIFVVTDGEDNASRKDAAVEIQRSLQSVRLYAFVLYDELHGEEEDIGRDKFFEMVKSSGGFATGIEEARTGSFSHFVYDDRARAMIKASAQTITAQLSNYYLLSLDLENHPGSTDLKVEAIDASGRTRKDVTVTYPRKVTACANPLTRP